MQTQSKILFEGEEIALQQFLENKKIVIIADANTNGFCVNVACKIIPELKLSEKIIIPNGEKNKTIEITMWIWSEMQRLQINRNWVVVNIGGGVVCDIAGFAAATYMRGIKFINIPTTLLAMSDASFGGKTGINFGNFKNNIGVFANAQYTFIHTIFLKTLPQNQIINGAIESIKHALIADKNLWNNYIKASNIEIFITIENIKKSVLIKNNFVEKDPYDNNERQALNFGHTIGHAIEASSWQTNKPLLHGEAVLLGMIAELYLCEKYFQIPHQIKQDLINLKNKLLPNKKCDIVKKYILEKLLLDKKNTSTINCSLIKNIGEPVLKVPVTLSDFNDAIQTILN